MPKNKHKLKRIHLKRVCRCCLTERGHLREIMSTRIPMMIESCSSVKISECDGLPKHICVSCFHQIAKFYTFKTKIERSDRILHNYLKQRNKINSKEYSDILHRAVDDAEISIVSEDTPNAVINDSNEVCYDSEEDIPLSVIRDREFQAQEALHRNNLILDQVFNIESESEPKHINEGIFKLGDIFSEEIFSGGPPPLVPLDLTKSNNKEEENSLIKILPAAPPLVPIKDLQNFNSAAINNFATNIDEAVNLQLQCSACGEQFSSIISLREHRIRICQANELQCNICQKEFKDRKRLIGHLKGHMVVKDYCCKICGKCYPNASTFQIHMRGHTGEKPFNCPICSKAFARWASVVGHMKTHNSQKPYKCDICGKGFKMSSNLIRHKVLHTGILPFCCNYCGKTYSQAENLHLHIRTYHTYERPYLCNECGKGFVSLTRLNRHMWIHSGYKPYRCRCCSKTYSNSNDLKNHERRYHGNAKDTDKPYACKICDMRFFHPCRLSKHIRVHERPHSCTICSKSFTAASILKRHKSIKHSNKTLLMEEGNSCKLVRQ